jgi:hypothetical protein
MPKNRFSKGLWGSKKERPVLDLAMTVAEVISDAAVSDAALAAIPFVDIAFKVVKAKDTIADAMYAAKLVGFINGVGHLEDADRERVAKQLLEKEGAKVGETLLLVLDRVTDLDKPALLGFLFRKYAERELRGTQLRRLTSAVDLAFGDDLLQFLDVDYRGRATQDEDCRSRLVHTGLTALNIATGWDAKQPTYECTELGVRLFELVNGFRP